MKRSDIPTSPCRPASERASALVLAMVLIFSLSILVVGMGNALTSTSIQNDRLSAESELVYAAIGFVHMVRADLRNGFVSPALRQYDMDSGREPYETAAEWDGRSGPRIMLTFRTQGRDAVPSLADDELRITARAERHFSNLVQSVEVSATVSTSAALPFDAYFGSPLKVGANLTTNTGMGIKGDVTGSVKDYEVVHNEDVALSGEYATGGTPGGNGTVMENTDVPDVVFDIEKMISDLYLDPNVAFSHLQPGMPGLTDDQNKGIRLRFDAAYPDSVFISVTNAAINAVNNPFQTEVEWPLEVGPDGALIVLEDFQYTVVQGEYSHPITIVTKDGPLSIDANLRPAKESLPGIGLIAADPDHGDVFVRLARNRNDYGFGNNENGVINAHIYAQGNFKGWRQGNNPNNWANSIEISGRIIAKGADGESTDLHEIARSRTFWGPTNDLYPPGMDDTRITSSVYRPRIKNGSWTVRRAEFSRAD